jgi:hypothetical protein
VEEEVQLTEPEERILGEFLRQFSHAAEEAKAGRMSEQEAKSIGDQGLGAFMAILQFRGLDPTKHRSELDGSGRVRVVESP